MEQFKPEGLSEKDLKVLMDHTFKICGDTTFPEDQIIQGIVNDLHLMKNSDHFAQAFDIIDPDQNHSETKQLSEIGKERIRKAIEIFSNEV